MTVSEAMRARKSVRAFADKAVEREKLERVLDAGRLAPSASNRQEWRFVVVTAEKTRAQLAEAPVVIVACAETDHHVMSCGHLSFLIDVAIAVDHITLAATAEGLGTCWIGAFDPEKVRSVLDIPSEIEVVELLPLGYPADPKIAEKRRLPDSQTVHFEKW